jgi:hypothetical protein
MTVTELQLDSMCVVRQIFAQSSPLVQYVQSCNSAGLPGRYAKEKLGLFLIAVLQSHNLVACGKARKIKKSDASNVRKSNSGRRNILMQPTAHTWIHFFYSSLPFKLRSTSMFSSVLSQSALLSIVVGVIVPSIRRILIRIETQFLRSRGNIRIP